MKDLPKKSGIYQITCLSTGKIYIGSAVNIYVRCLHHRRVLRRNTHVNAHLQSAWIKHGEEDFVFSVLELVNMDQLIATEQKWMDETQCYNREFGYNVRSIAESNAGIVRTDEIKKKLSIARTGKKFGPLSDEHKQTLSNIHRGKKYWEHTEETRRKISVTRTGHRHSPETRELLSERAKARGILPATREANIEARSKLWVVIDPQGNEYTIKNLEKFCRDNGLTARGMLYVAQGKYTHHKGWKCRYTEEES
jgi:group I intron endonuclease